MRARVSWKVLSLGLAAASIAACADGTTVARPDAPGALDASALPDVAAFTDTNRPDAGSDVGLDGGPSRTGQICDACATDDDCGELQYCAPLTVGGRACVPSCDLDLPDCPRAFNCIIDVAVSTDAVCEPVGGPCCVDEDADGYGRGVGCMGADCGDGDPDRNPGRPDLCNSMDDDCDGTVDESEAEICDDGIDQDCDMDVDCADSDCADGVACDALGRV
jgi:hypothetical protein